MLTELPISYDQPGSHDQAGQTSSGMVLDLKKDVGEMISPTPPRDFGGGAGDSACRHSALAGIINTLYYNIRMNYREISQAPMPDGDRLFSNPHHGESFKGASGKSFPHILLHLYFLNFIQDKLA